MSSAKAAEGGASAAALRPPGAVERGAGAVRFTVSLSRAAKTVVTVRAATADRTARAGADYRKKSAKLRFAPGQTKKSFLVRVLRDTRAERTETLKVKLSSATNATIARALATGTIVNR